MFNTFRWRGERIENIREWAKERGEKMINYRATRLVPGFSSRTLELEEQEGSMPESFWYNMQNREGWRFQYLSEETSS
jgi:hypothetical protein